MAKRGGFGGGPAPDFEALRAFLDTLDAATRDFLIKAGIINADGAINLGRQLQDFMLLFDAGFGPTPSTLAQIRSMNAGQRRELQEKQKWIKERIAEGYTREQARHLYYEWAGERDLNPNKTLSDDEIEDLYSDYEEGLTPNYVASVEQAVEARDIKGGLTPGRGDYPESKEPTVTEEPSYQDQVAEAIEAGAEGDISDPKDTVDLDLFADTTDDDTTTGDLSDDVDFSGQVDDGLFILDVLQEADFNAGNDVVLPDGTVINNRTHEQTGTPGYGGGILVTERDVVVEDEDGGGGGADTTTTTTTAETTTTTDAGAGDTIYADEPSTGPLEIGDGTDELIGQLEEAIEAEQNPEIKEDLEDVLEDLQEMETEEPKEEVEQPQPDVFDPAETVTETTETTEEAGADEDDDDGLLFIPGLPEDETVVDTPDDVVVTEVDEVVVDTPETDDLLDSEVEVPADTTEVSDTSDEGQAPGDGQEGTGETGTGEEGTGDDGTGEGEGGDGDGDEEPQPQRKPFTPEPIQAGLLTGSVPYQDIPFVGVPYEQKDYMVELNSLINRSLFGDLIK